MDTIIKKNIVRLLLCSSLSLFSSSPRNADLVAMSNKSPKHGKVKENAEYSINGMPSPTSHNSTLVKQHKRKEGSLTPTQGRLRIFEQLASLK